MYLKCLELVGFKSFAEKTRLEFEPGMTAIVGPNGCGKSNVSDAVRWVLGEQSAKAMRGAKMEDVIFNGTDSHKPLGMAEVSMTLADCEQALGTEYHEVTVTRRVFRTGEGQYFINKAPCRLKDIQRLFMDTGIGTNSYSLMEQGKIDRILSSHPEDRRAVFEEASGITKYKADRKEAMRKLEQTEANLLRLDDIIREVKRQIISLQRQAGKAKRYQTLQTELRALDLFSTRERLQAMDDEIRTLESRLSSISEQDEAARQDIEQSEQEATRLRDQVHEVEQRISAAMEAAVAARTELERMRELTRNNQDRIQELQGLSERDTRDAEEARQRRDQHEGSLREQQARLERATRERDTAERELAEHVARLTEAEQQVDEAAKLIHRLRTEQVDLDMRAANLQNELSQLDAEERTNILRRERLSAEHAETRRGLEVYEGRQGEMTGRLQQLRAAAEDARHQLEALQGQRCDKMAAVAGLKQTLSDLRSQVAARRAQIELLEASREQREGYSEGARRLLDTSDRLKVDRSLVLGPLAEMIHIDAAYHAALEAALRPWLDAVVVQGDDAALAVLRDLESQAAGSVRLLALGERGASPVPPGPGQRLVDLLQAAEPLKATLLRVIGHVRVVDQLGDVPQPLPDGVAYVTRGGALLSANGVSELWKRDESSTNPLTRQQLLNTWKGQLSELMEQVRAHERSVSALEQEEASVEQAIADARRALEDHRRQMNLAEGEHQVIAQEAQQARERVETVAWELKLIEDQHHTGDDRRTGITRDIEAVRNRQAEIRTTISAKTEELRDLEQTRSRCLADVTDRRVRFSESRQMAESLAAANQQLASRVAELSTLIDERARGISSYQSRIADLQKAVADAAGRVAPLEQEAAAHAHTLEQEKARREEVAASLHTIDASLRGKRNALEDIRSRKSQCDVELAQQRIRRQNLLERVTSEYRIAPEQVAAEPEPAWENGQRPDRETLETQVAELRAKLEAMGPVNLVAIEEHRELEERYQFLTNQQSDLTSAKTQLMDLIRQINKTTTEMFAQTFDAVNRNFQEMFTKLFGGGSAKLVLIDDGDVLESGIEIIARPPGKKLQTVSLLSGGERTMTAVALLFSLYQVKPSPFCVLDELDAALDDANIGRFVKTVQGFLENSQFVVITHNRQTISAARMLYGVTMEQQGVSKIVSVKFSEHETREDRYPPQPSDPAPAPAAT